MRTVLGEGHRRRGNELRLVVEDFAGVLEACVAVRGLGDLEMPSDMKLHYLGSTFGLDRSAVHCSSPSPSPPRHYTHHLGICSTDS